MRVHACTVFQRIATATSACGACATASGGSPCRQKVSVTAPCIVHQHMQRSRSPSPSPAAAQFAERCFHIDGNADYNNVGEKRSRHLVIAETLLPSDSNSDVASHARAPAPVHTGQCCVLEESCHVPPTQHSLNFSSQAGGSALQSQPIIEKEDDEDFDDDPIPAHWHAGIILIGLIL